MPIEEVNQVQEDGRIRLPPKLREKYAGYHMAIYEDSAEDDRVILEKVTVSGEE